VGALPDIIEHERTGVIVKPGDVEGLASAMGRLASLRLGLKQLTAEMRILHLTDEVDPIRGTTGTGSVTNPALLMQAEALGQRFHGLNHIRRPRRACRTMYG
jgi:hypothetical protein